MVDISVVETCLLWTLPAVVGQLALRLARRINQRSFRVVIKAAGSVLFALGTFLVLFGTVAEVGCHKRPPILPSPDGRYVAIVDFVLGSALDSDIAHVSVRRSWTPWWTYVYDGVGAWDRKTDQGDPEVRWLNKTHLLIRSSYITNDTTCLSVAGEVTVRCEKIE